MRIKYTESIRKKTFFTAVWCLTLIASYVLAQQDQFQKTIESARLLIKQERAVLWSVPTDSRAADIIEFLDEDRVLVGEINGGGMYKLPSYGPIKLLSAETGEMLWSVSRKKSPDMTYILLTTKPNIVLTRVGIKNGEIRALDVSKGKLIWRMEIGKLATVQTSLDQKTLYVMSQHKGKYLLENVDINHGNIIWKAAFDGAHDLIITDINVITAGTSIQAFDAESGKEQWQSQPKGLMNDNLSIVMSPHGLIAWSANGMALLSFKNGKSLWFKPVSEGGVKRVTFDGERLFRIIGSPDILGTDKLQAVNAADGRILWTIDTKGLAVSSLLIHKSIITFTIEEALLGVKTADGKMAFRKTFKQEYAKANPVSARFSGIPDVLYIYKDLLIIDRERMGLLSFHLPSGKEAWQSPVLRGRSVVDDRYRDVLLGTKMDMALIPSSAKMLDWTAPRPSPTISQAQRLHEETIHHKNNVLDNINATRHERWAAIQAAQVSTSLEITRLETHMSLDRSMKAAATALAIANAAISLGETIKKLKTELLFSGLLTRARMGLRGAIRGREAAFKDDVHWTFFSDHKSSGLRFINLDSGKINTLLYEPADALHRITMVPTEVIGFSPSGRRLILVGLGLDSDKYRTAKSGGIKGAKASILCFDPFQKKPHYTPPLRSDRKIGTKIGKVKYPSMHAAILAGDINAVRAMLDNGEDPNQKISMNPAVSDQVTTPLRAAAAGYPEIVRLLLERGAEFKTLEEIPGLTALDYASEQMDGGFPQFKEARKEVRTILKAAGAKYGLFKERQDLSMKEINDENRLPTWIREGANHLFILRKKLNDPALNNNWKKKPVVLEMLREGKQKLARMLLERGADVNAVNADGLCALQVAVFKLEPSLVIELLKYKADPNIVNQLGITPLTHFFSPYSLPYKQPYKERIKEIVTLLLEHGADPNTSIPQQPDGTKITLLEAAKRKNRELAEIIKTYITK